MKSLSLLTTLHPSRLRRQAAPMRLAALLLLAGLSLPTLAVEPAGSAPAAEASADTARRAAVEQKLRLMEKLADAPANRAEDPAAADHRARVTELVANARRDLAAGQTEQAGTALDQAIRLASTGSQRKTLTASSHQDHLQGLVAELDAYRRHVLELERDPQLGTAAQALRRRIDDMTGEAARHHAAGRFGDAHRLLSAANKLAIAELGRLRAGKTVVVALKFDSPADEFAHEQRRLVDHEMLVRMALAEGRGDGERRAQVDHHVAESERLRREAEGQAQGGSYTEAVGTMEKATAVLVRALQNLGVPVF